MKEKSLPMRPPACAQPLIAVRDVPAASRWYQRLLGCHSLHGGSEYEQLGWQADGHDFFMQLHAWGEHDHPNLGNEQAAPHGYGVLLWFEVQAFDEVVQRAQSLNAEVLKPSFFNDRAQHREIWLRDLDGYVVVLASPYGNTGATEMSV